jgi:maltose-binding protein MalE
LKNKIVQQSLYAREVGRMMPVTPALRGIWNAMKPAYQAIINGSMSPEEASARMQRDAEKFINEMYEKY